jgi:hypothetical protein
VLSRLPLPVLNGSSDVNSRGPAVAASSGSESATVRQIKVTRGKLL